MNTVRTKPSHNFIVTAGIDKRHGDDQLPFEMLMEVPDDLIIDTPPNRNFLKVAFPLHGSRENVP